MYICYLDESGTSEPGSSTDHFVLLGLAIPADSWKLKDEQVDGLKSKYGLQDKEVHTAWVLRDYPEQNRVTGFASMDWEARRKTTVAMRALNLQRPRKSTQQKELLKNYRKSADCVHLTRVERTQLVCELAELVGSWNDVRIFADARAKNHLPGVEHYEPAFEQVVARFNKFLEKANGPGGLLVQDNNQTVAMKLTRTMRRFHREGTTWDTIGKIIETPMFVDSALTSDGPTGRSVRLRNPPLLREGRKRPVLSDQTTHSSHAGRPLGGTSALHG